MQPLSEASSSLLGDLQGALERLYDFALPYRVVDFLYATEGPVDGEGRAVDPDRPSERVLLRETPGELQLRLCLDASTLAAARRLHAEGTNTLDREHLEAMLDVIEGVSHAVALLWHALNDRPVGPVALELQAGIDKYVLLQDALGDAVTRDALHDALFARRTHLDAGYRLAHRLAACYCRWLAPAGDRAPERDDDRAAELARFYRLPAATKLATLTRLERRIAA